jgi:diacylglycerol kinase family enzyme
MARISPSRRAAAIIALPLVAGTTLFVVLVVYRNATSLLLALVGLSLGVAAAWWAITEFGLRRWLGVFGSVVGVVMVTFAIFSAVDRPEHWVARIAGIVAILAATLALARYSLRRPVPTDGEGRISVGPRPARPVLLCNPWSGGGKVELFGLVDVASHLGVEVVMLDHGLDLEQLTRDAVARGADCLGMAGGDGSQALVASVAIEHDLPFVCIPAGTRNHFALDLGLDRDDPRSAMVAFRDAIQRRVDYATVNDRLFVNNVSLGVYAEIVQSDDYRDAKVEVARQHVRRTLGRRGETFDLQYTAPSGHEIDGAFLVMVSNNPYVLEVNPDAAQRRQLDTGRLGVFAISTKTGAQAAALVTLSALGLRNISRVWYEFAPTDFEVRSWSGSAYLGVDGEALEYATPLRFRIHPGGLRMYVPQGNLEAAERRRARSFGVADVARVARGIEPYDAAMRRRAAHR